MKYYLFLIITLLSVKNALAQSNVADKGNCILDLRNNKVLLIGNDTIKPDKKDNIFSFPVTTDIIINKVMLPDTAKTSHSFKVTLNGELVGKETKDKKSHNQDIPLSRYNVYTIYWGNINWKICCSDEFTKKFDLILLDTTQICIRTINGEEKQNRTEKGTFELNDTLRINSVRFPEEGFLSIICNSDTILQKKVQKIEDNLGLILYKGKKYVFTIEGKKWNIGIEEEINDSANDSSLLWGIVLGIIISIISCVLFTIRKSIKRFFIRSKYVTTNCGVSLSYKSKSGNINVGTFATPDGFHTLEDGRFVFVEKKTIKLFFPAESLRLKDCDNNDIIINCKGDNPQCGDSAYPNGVFFMPDNTIMFVESYSIKDIKTIETKEAERKQELDVSDEIESTSGNWYSSLTYETISQLKSIDLKIEEFNSYDELCSKFVTLISSIKGQTHNYTPEVQQKSEDDFIKAFIMDMEKKPNIRLAFKEKRITTKSELINEIDTLLMKSKSNEVSYTLKELKLIAETKQLNCIDGELKDNVFNVYVRRYLSFKFNLDWNENTILSNAITGITVIKSTELENKALEIIGKFVGLKFIDKADFLGVWNDKTTDCKSPSIEVDSKLINRLKHLADSKNKTIDEILGELENPQMPVPDTQEEILINGKSVDQVKEDLDKYERIKSLAELAEFGSEAKDVKYRLSNIGKTELIKAVQNAVQNSIPNWGKIESFKNLKTIVEKIVKADSADKIAKAVGGISTIVEEMCSLKDDKEKAVKEKDDANTLIIDEVKSHYMVLFEEDLSSEDPIYAIDKLIEKVKNKISNCQTENNKLQIIVNGKDEEIKTLYQDYSTFILTAFEHIENDLVRTCKNANSKDALPAKFIQRVIKNDAFDVYGFMENLKSIINNPKFKHDDVQTSLKELFLDAVQNNSWIQTLSHIYLYVQNPQVASYFTQNKIDVRSIYSSFILTEQMLRAFGIKLHYPMLFEDIYDSNLYDESTLSDVKDYVNDVKELVGDRQGVIIDMFRLGYTANGETHKAKVTRFN